MKDTGFHDHVMQDVLVGIPGIRSRAMFGGWGIYMDGVMFALIADGELYFKVDKDTQAEYEKHGSHPFVYDMKSGKQTTMSYWLLPEDIMEDSEAVKLWVKTAVSVSRQSKKRLPSRKKK